MNFRGVDKYHGISECGRYTISRSYLGEHSTYEAWRKSPGSGQPSTPLYMARFKNAEDEAQRQRAFSECVRACSLDAEGRAPQ